MKITDQKDENPWPPLTAAIGESRDNDVIVRNGARVLIIHGHEIIMTYFERRIEPYGLVRVQTSSQGLEIWVGGERRYVWKPST